MSHKSYLLSYVTVNNLLLKMSYLGNIHKKRMLFVYSCVCVFAALFMFVDLLPQHTPDTKILFKMISKKRKVFLYIVVGLSYIEWSILLSLLPPFYPSEAENKGCTSSQVKHSKYSEEFLLFSETYPHFYTILVWLGIWNCQSRSLPASTIMWKVWNKDRR